MNANRVKTRDTRTTLYIVLSLALMLAAVVLSIVPSSRSYAASAAFVQGQQAQVTSGTTASLAFSKANTAGNLIVVYVVWDNPGTVKVSDTKGNTYTAATTRQTWGTNWSAQVFYASNILAGSNTVKATFSTAITSFGIVYLHEYSGLANASAVDGSASAVGTSASMSSGAVTTTQANDVLFAAGASDVTVSQGTGFTTRLAGFGNLTEDRVVTTAGSYAGTASQNGSTWVMQLVAFRITSAVGPPAKLAFVQGPSSAAAGATMTPAVTVAVEDANGNIETSDNATTIGLAIGTNPAGGTLSGGSAVTVASGVATFSGLSINTAGTGYTLTASSTPAYTAATSATFSITSAAPSPGWTTYLQGNDRSGFASGESGFNTTSVRTLQLAWRAVDTAPNHGVFSQPIVSNGLVYWGSFDGFERASTTSGTLVWKTNLGTTSPSTCTDPAEAGVASTPAITTDVPVNGANSVLYVGGGDSKVYALNAATGAVLWSYDVGGNPNTFVWSSPAVFGNSVYIGVASFGSCPDVQGELLQLNRVTGALQNRFNVVPNGCIGGGVWSSPAIDAAAGTIYFTTGNQDTCPTSEMAPAIVEVRASDLSLLGSWTVPLAQQTCCGDGDWAATPTLFNGVIGGKSQPMVGSINKNGVFYAFVRDALSSGPVWSKQIATGGENPTTGTGDIAPAAWDGTTLYVGGDATSSCTGTVNALNPSTGAFIWQHCFTDGPVLGAVTVASGGVVAVGEGNAIQVVSAATGASLFTFTGVGPFWGPSSIVGGTLYEGDMSGNLYALTTNQTPTGQFVQVNSATPQANENTVTVPYLQAQSAGDLNVVAIGFDDSTSTITSVTDNAGNVYQLAAQLSRGSGLSQAIYYAKNIKAAAAGANVVTVQFSDAAPFPDVRVAEYSGLDPVNPLDASASAAGNGSTASSGNLTTTAASEVIFGAGYTSGLFEGGTNGFASRIITQPDGDIAGDELVSTPGTYAATASLASPGTWVMQAAAFRVG